VRKLTESAELAPPPAPQEQHLALTRRDFVVRRTELSAGQFALLSALKQGGTVGEAIAAALAVEDFVPEQIRDWFDAWTAGGFFRRLR
jgi:hypothetical protein